MIASSNASATLLQHLQLIPDPRLARKRRHELQSILAVAMCATIAGAYNWVEVAEFGEPHHDWFVRFIPLHSGKRQCTDWCWPAWCRSHASANKREEAPVKKLATT